ncbi:tryptophan--tRNA ligase [Patescibacteria group bacterium]
MTDKGLVLTGDRPTGPLHLGHYIGSLRKRVEYQEKGHPVFIIIADWQVLNEDPSRSGMIRSNIETIILDYLSVGIDPKQTNIFIQSQVPAITILTEIFQQITPYSWLANNPTVKDEMRRHLERMGRTDVKVGKEERAFTVGFFAYPVSQAADILFCLGEIVPVGKDQEPHINLARDIAGRFNDIYGRPIFPKPECVVDTITPRLPGLGGPDEKMGKSAGNAIFLSDPIALVWEKLKGAYTDPEKPKKGDTGHPDICPIFAYWNAFEAEWDNIASVREDCESGSLGCFDCKKRFFDTILQPFLQRIHERREVALGSVDVWEIVRQGTSAANKAGEGTLELVREVMGIDYPM